MKVLNLTQHRATQDQLTAGLVDLGEEDFKRLTSLLTFETLPTEGDIEGRAGEIFQLSRLSLDDSYHVMIGGAPWLMGPLARRFAEDDILAVFSFSTRVTEEVTLVDGTVKKTSVFKHLGWVPAC